jgi:hypothetical protein
MPHRIYPNIAISEKFNSCSLKSQLLYLELFAFVDDFGTFLGDPKDIKALIFPKNTKMNEQAITRIEAELLDAGLLMFYSINGKLYLQISDFKRYQVFGQGYNRIPKYPPLDESDHSVVSRIFGDEITKNRLVYTKSADLLKTLVNAWHTTTSYTNTNTNSNSYKEEQIEKIDNLLLEEKEVLKCFIYLGEKIKDNTLENWKKWLAELRKENPNKDLVKNAKKWRDYFEGKPPKRYKNSFRNWIEKDYADKKVSEIDDILYQKSREFDNRYKNLKK